MATSKTSVKTFGKVMSVILVIALLCTTYGSFFSGLTVKAHVITAEGLAEGETRLGKTAVQDGREVNVTVQTVSKAATISESEQPDLDVVIIIDTSGSMAGSLMTNAKSAAISLAKTLFAQNPENRVALGSFAQDAYAYANNTTAKTVYSSMPATSANYFFTSSQISDFQKRVNALNATGGTNTEGGMLVADKLVKAADPERQKLVVFLTDGLPTGRYKDSKTKENATATYDGSGSGLPNYVELTEMLEAAKDVAANPGTQMATIFYTGGLSKTTKLDRYYIGCDSTGKCNCAGGSNTHGYKMIAKPASAKTEEEQFMSMFYGSTELTAASIIMNDLLAEYSHAGLYLPENANAMLSAFETIVKELTIPAATAAVYTEVIPEYAEVDESSIVASRGNAVVIKNKEVDINGKKVLRDVLTWELGTIPSDIQTLNYTLTIKDDSIFGIADVSEQGLLTFTPGKAPNDSVSFTRSPLVAQIDEIVIPPRAANDYYVIKQEQVLSGNVAANDALLNTLVDTSGNTLDASKLVGGVSAGVKGTQKAMSLTNPKVEIISQPSWGTVEITAEGTFAYKQNPSLFEKELVNFAPVAGAPAEYSNAGAAGWEDSFTYRLSSGAGLESEPVTARIRIIPDLSNLAASKSANPANGSLVKPGDTIVYTIEVFNPRTVPAADTVITDSAPLGTTIIADSVQGGTVDGNNVSWVIDSIPPRTKTSVTFSVKVSDEVAGAGNLSNTALVSFVKPGESETAQIATNSVTHAILSAVKTSDVPADMLLTAGDRITYTISVTNNGAADASNVEVRDTVNDAVTFVSSDSFTASGNYLTAVIDSIKAGETKSVSFIAQVADFTSGRVILENTATVTDFSTNTVTNSAVRGTVTVRFIDEAGTELADPISAGGRYGESYGPYGAAEVANYELSDIEGSPSGVFDETDKVVTYIYKKIPATATINYVDVEGNTLLTPVIIGGYQGDTLTDTRYTDITYYEFIETRMPTSILNAAGITVEHVYKRIPDLTKPEIFKSSSPASGSILKAGDPVSYFVSITNLKNEAMTNVIIRDTVPAGMSLVDAGGANAEGDNLAWVISNLEPGESTVVSFTVRVNDSVGGEDNFSNIASVTYRDRDASEDTVLNTNATGHAFLNAVKSATLDKDSFAGEGETYAYSITVKNSGSAVAENVTINDNVAEGLTVAAGESPSCVIPRLEAGAVYTHTYNVTVNNFEGYSRSFVAGAYVNDIPTNIVTTHAKRATVSVSYLDEDGRDLLDSRLLTGKPGTTYDTGDAPQVYGYRYVSTSGSQKANFAEGNISVVYNYEKVAVKARIRYIDEESGKTLLDEISKTLYVGDRLESSYLEEIHNYTHAGSVGYTDESSLEYNTSGIDIVHYYRFIKADTTPVSLVKSASAENGSILRKGDEVTFTLSLENVRIDSINSLVIYDAVPAGMSLVSDSFSGVNNEGKLTWELGTVEAGQTAQVSFTAVVDEVSAAGSLSNTAYASFTNRDDEPEAQITSNTINYAYLSYELTSVTQNPSAILTQGDTITYILTVSNLGSVEAENVDASALIPDGTTFKYGEGGKADAGKYNATIDSIAPGAETVIYYTVTVDEFDDNVYSETFVNAPTVNGVTGASVKDTAKVGRVKVSYLDFDGTELSKPITAEGRIGAMYGPYTAPSFDNRVIDTKLGSANGQFVEALTEIVYTYKRIPAVLTVNYIDIETGEAIITPVTVTGAYQGDTYSASHAEKFEIDGYIYEDCDAAKDRVYTAPVISITHRYTRILDTDQPVFTKTGSPADGALVKAGDTITYTLTAQNVRKTDPLNDVVITDTVPAGTELLDAGTAEVIDGVLTWNIGNIAVGKTEKVSFTVTVNEKPEAGSLGNTAYISYIDPQTRETPSIPSNPVRAAVLVSNKSTNIPLDEVLYEGETITYNVEVTNVGTASASDIVITDTVPAGTTLIGELAENAVLDGSVITWKLDSLAPSESAAVGFTVRIASFEDGEYRKTVANTASVNGIDTNTTENIVKKCTVKVSYVDEDGMALQSGIELRGKEGIPYTLPAQPEFYGYALKHIDRSNDKGVFEEGCVNVTYVYYRIPAAAFIRYIDIETGAALREQKVIDGFVGNIIESTEYQDFENYTFVETIAPETLELKDGGMIINHYYEEIPDTTLLNVVKSSDPANMSLVKTGDSITYTITVKNPRREPISNVTVSDRVPLGATLVSANGAEVNGEALTWQIDKLEKGEEASFSYTVKVNDQLTGSDNLTGAASVTYTNRKETTPTTVSSNVVSHAVVTALLKVNKTETAPYDALIYTIEVENHGAIAAKNVTVTDAIPVGTRYISGSAYGSRMITEPTDATKSIRWNIGTMESGESIELGFNTTVRMLADGEYEKTIVNTAKLGTVDTNTVESVASQGIVKVVYVDENDKQLAKTISIGGVVGEEYEQLEPIEIDGYEFKRAEGEVSGVYTSGETTVKFIYDKTTASVVIRYVDENGNVIATTTTEVLGVGDEVTDIAEKVIDGYTKVSTDVPDSLVVTADGVEITHVYKVTETTYKAGGRVWLDSNDNSTYDDGELCLSGVEVKAYNANGELAAAAATRGMSDKGTFSFDSLTEGTYTFSFTLPNGMAPARSLVYSDYSVNSVTDQYGSTEALLLTKDMTNIGMGLSTDVLGAQDAVAGTQAGVRYLDTTVNTATPILTGQVIEDPLAYSSMVLGDDDVSAPKTGDSGAVKTLAIVFASCALFILIIVRKR